MLIAESFLLIPQQARFTEGKIHISIIIDMYLLLIKVCLKLAILKLRPIWLLSDLTVMQARGVTNTLQFALRMSCSRENYLSEIHLLHATGIKQQKERV